MCFTSDQQLAALGLRRMEDLPQRVGFQFYGFHRNLFGADFRIDASECYSYLLGGGVARHDDLVGWRPGK